MLKAETQCLTGSFTEVLCKMRVSILVVSFALSWHCAAAGVPEPSFLLYGEAEDVNGNNVGVGTLFIVYETGSVDVVSEVELQDAGFVGNLSYVARIRVESSIPGDPVGAGIIELPSEARSYARYAYLLLDGERYDAAPLADTALISPAAHRGYTEQQDLVFPELDIAQPTVTATPTPVPAFEDEVWMIF